MPLILDSGPAVDPVTLEEVKEHIRVDSDDEDTRIADYIRAATERLDGRDGSLGRCLITQTWRMTLDRFSGEITIPLPPCQRIDAITYADAAGDEQTLPPSAYQVFGLGTVEGAIIRPVRGKDWPATASAPAAVTIIFTAGFGDNPEDIPESIRTAIKMRAGHLYAHRESVMTGSGYVTETPDGADDFVRNHKIWSF